MNYKHNNAADMADGEYYKTLFFIIRTLVILLVIILIFYALYECYKSCIHHTAASLRRPLNQVVVIGGYEYNTNHCIGYGAFSIVYKGQCRNNPHMCVAIKTIMKEKIMGCEEILNSELDILRKLSKKNIHSVVQFHESLETGNAFHLVMEYCNGGDLQDYLNVKGRINETTIKIFLRQLAGALHVFNEQKIVHRDLKPENILLKFTGETRYPEPDEITLKIADFGLARLLDEDGMAQTYCGTPKYMAPEVVKLLEYDGRADLWSLGSIIYQCLTGGEPFFANTLIELKMIFELTDKLQPRIPPGTTPEMSDLLIGLLKINPENRLSFLNFFHHPFLITNP